MAQNSEGIYKNNTFQLGYGTSCLLSAEWFVSIFFFNLIFKVINGILQTRKRRE